MLMASMRLNIPTVFVSGGPMEAGEWGGQHLDLIDAMIKSADSTVSDEDVAEIDVMLVRGAEAAQVCLLPTL